MLIPRVPFVINYHGLYNRFLQHSADDWFSIRYINTICATMIPFASHSFSHDALSLLLLLLLAVVVVVLVFATHLLDCLCVYTVHSIQFIWRQTKCRPAHTEKRTYFRSQFIDLVFRISHCCWFIICLKHCTAIGKGMNTWLGFFTLQLGWFIIIYYSLPFSYYVLHTHTPLLFFYSVHL